MDPAHASPSSQVLKMSNTAQYTISELAHYSGVKPHTIRIWEKRFNLLSPTRSCTNIRGYGYEELRKLINIHTLLQSGWKISRIVGVVWNQTCRMSRNRCGFQQFGTAAMALPIPIPTSWCSRQDSNLRHRL